MTNLKWFMLGILCFSCAGSALNIAVFRGNHKKQRLERQVVVDGKKKWEVILPSDPVFSDMQAIHKLDLEKVQRFYNQCIKAGVSPD